MSKHSIQTFKPSLNKWRKRLLWVALVAFLLPPLIFLRDVYRIPDYRGSNAYISTSPDGLYQGIEMFLPNDSQLGWKVVLAHIFSGYDPYLLISIADGQTGRILAFAHINHNDMSNGRGSTWDCIDIREGPCVLFQGSFRDTKLELPPSPWYRLVAWGAYTLRGLGEPDFGKIQYDKSTVFTPGQFDDH